MPSCRIPLAAALLAGTLTLPLAAQAPGPRRLDPAARRAIVDSVANVLERRYVDAELARRLAATIRAGERAGRYAGDTLAPMLGTALQRDLRAVVDDQHLRLNYEPTVEFTGPAPLPAGAAPAAGGGDAVVARLGDGTTVRRSARIDGRDSATIARTNFGFARVERLDGNVGYLKLTRFVPLDYSQPTAVAAMAFLAHSDAVIVDLRDNIGGSPDLVTLLLSYFTGPAPRVLLTSRNRALDQTVERTSLPEVPGRRLTGTPLYILVSRETASAAEMFAYSAQQLNLATVVGERTAGAGNGGSRLSVGGGLALFIPEWRITLGPGYERTGVVPHVVTTADAALEVAHARAREAISPR